MPPIVRALLADALASEAEAKQLGPKRAGWPPVVFPLPTCLFAHGLCGAVNRDGSIAVAPRFDFVDNFHEGRAVVRLGGLYGYVDLDDKIVVEPQYAIAGPYRLGVAEVDIDGKSALIDLTGRRVVAPRFARAGPFTTDVFWVNDGVRESRGPPGGAVFAETLQPRHGRAGTIFVKGKWGLIDRAGAWIRQPEFTDVEIFDRESSDLMWAKAAAGWGLIRPDGTWLVEPTFERVRALSGGLAAVWRGHKMGFVDRTGTLVIPHEFEGTSFDWADPYFVEGMPAPVKLQGREGVIDRAGNWVIEPTYDSIQTLYRGGPAPDADMVFKGFLARRGEKRDLLDASGKVVVRDLKIDNKFLFAYQVTSSDEIARFPLFCTDGRIIGVVGKTPRMFARDGTPINPPQGQLWWPLSCQAPYAVKVGIRFGYVDAAMRPVTEPKFEEVGLFHNGLATAKLAGKYGLLRPDGTWALEPDFDHVQPERNGLALVKVGGRAAVIAVATGALRTSTRFDDVCSRGRGIVGVVLDGKMGALDHDGQWLFEPRHERFHFGLNQELVPVRSDGKWGFLDAAGNSIAAQFDEVGPLRTRGELGEERRRMVPDRSARQQGIRAAVPNYGTARY